MSYSAGAEDEVAERERDGDVGESDQRVRADVQPDETRSPEVAVPVGKKPLYRDEPVAEANDPGDEEDAQRPSGPTAPPLGRLHLTLYR